MARLVWGAAGQRFYEAGTDRGVLYIDNVGVPWNGLKAVREAPTGGEPKAFYLDGIKYLNISASEEFAATIDAYSAPNEFGVCEGQQEAYMGLFVTHQPRKSFGMCYRTRIGNDLDGLDLGYKIHIVYNALPAPNERSNQTINDSAEPLALSWSITTLAPPIAGYRPTAHFVVDSRFTPPNTLMALEDILYGSASGISTLPSPQQILDLFESMASLLTVIDLGDGEFSAVGTVVDESDEDVFEIDDDYVTDHGDGTYTVE